jgi:GTPase
MGFKSGFVCIAGLPNAGKSTLINRVLESKLLAVSDKPQTTRNNILGIFTSKDAQIIFIDTPGYHNIQKEINKFYVNEAVSASNKADLVVYLFDAKESLSKRLVLNDEFITEILKKKDREKILPVVSKVDLLRPEQFLKLKKRLSEQYGFNEDKILGVSVPKSVGVAELLLKIKETLPEGPMYYAEDDLTDRNLRFLCAELIREKIFLFTKEEIPYSTAVQITKYEEKSALHRIFADIYVEKDTQKGIIVGSNGSMIKKIGSAARKDIEELVDSKVYLELFVKVKKDWTKDKEFLKELGYK